MGLFLHHHGDILCSSCECFQIIYCIFHTETNVFYQIEDNVSWYMATSFEPFRALNRPQKGQNIVLNGIFSKPYSLFVLFLSNINGLFTRCKITIVLKPIWALMPKVSPKMDQIFLCEPGLKTESSSPSTVLLPDKVSFPVARIFLASCVVCLKRN